MQKSLYLPVVQGIDLAYLGLNQVLLFSFMFCLLGFGYLQQQARWSAFKDELPLSIQLQQAPGGQLTATPEHEKIQLHLDFDNRLFWNGQEINDRQLAQRLYLLQRYAPSTSLELQINRLVPYQTIFKTIAIARAAGVTVLDFGLGTDHHSEAQTKKIG